MLDRTPFQQFLAPRLATARTRLGGMIWRDASAPLAVARTRPTHEHRPASAVDSGEFEPIDPAALPLAWGRKFEQCWWRVTLPDDPGGGRRWLRWDDQGEATVYRRDGQSWTPHFGLDPGHGEAPLPDEAHRELLVESVCCRTGIWVSGAAQGIGPEGSLFRGARLLSRDEDAWHAWHDLDVLIGVCELLYRRALPRPYGPTAGNDLGSGGGGLFAAGGFRTPVEAAPPLLRVILRRLNDAADAHDRDGPAAMRQVTQQIVADLPAGPHEIAATLTGHAHIDLAWLWPERVGDFKAVHSFATVDRLLDEYPELHFGYSQPASYEAVANRAPGLIDRVKRRAADGGRWEPTGAMYVESDTQIPCGEALVRAVELGQAGFRDLCGEDSRVLWLPDVFGYSAVLPQLLAGFGVPYFFTTKMHWSAGTRFPHSAFRWQSPGGEEVLGFIAWEHYNLEARPHELDWAASNQRQADALPETLVPTGFGDGGGGVTATMCERARRMADLAGVPRCRWGRIDGFFDRLDAVRDDLPTWRGEMYLEYHRGVQTTHVDLKQAYRAAERGLQLAEAAACATGEHPDLTADWKRVCWAQFHDVLPGSSIQEVYGEVVPELAAIGDRNVERAAELLGDGDGCVFNPVPCERIEVVDGRAVRVPPLASVRVADAEPVEAAEVRRDGDALDNGRVRATFDGEGRFVALAVDGREVTLAGPACGLMTFPDVPANYPAWDVDRHTLSIGEPCDAPPELAWSGDAARQELSVTRTVGRESRVTLRFSLDAASPVLRVEAEIDWRDSQTLLKLVVPTRYRSADALYGAPFGGTPRGQSGNTIADDARFEVPLSRWMVVGDGAGGPGVMLVSEATYGGGCRDGLMHLSLVRSAAITQAGEDVGLRDFDAYGQEGHRPHSDVGRHVVRLALGRFDPDAPRHEQPAQLADLLFTPLLRHGGDPRPARLLAIDGGPTVAAAWDQARAGRRPHAAPARDAGPPRHAHPPPRRRPVRHPRRPPRQDARPLPRRPNRVRAARADLRAGRPSLTYNCRPIRPPWSVAP